MSKPKRKRGKRGGRQAFLKRLKRELHSIKEFDPAKAFFSPPEEAIPQASPRPPARGQCNIPRHQQYKGKQPANATNTFVPARVPTQPLPVYMYARKPPSVLPAKLRVKQSIQTYFKVSRTAAGDFLIRCTEQNEGETLGLTF